MTGKMEIKDCQFGAQHWVDSRRGRDANGGKSREDAKLTIDSAFRACGFLRSQ